MANKNDGAELFNIIKTIVDNYVNNRQITDVVVGKYNGAAVVVEGLQLPMSIISGNMKDKLEKGDSVLLLRGDGGNMYYIMEITGKPYITNEEG